MIATYEIGGIAEAAGVAQQTVYATYGSKRALLMTLPDLIDEEGNVPANAALIVAAEEPAEVLKAAVHVPREIMERAGDIVAA